MSLKDENAVIDAVMWKGAANTLPFQPQDGVEVIATGRLTTFPGRSKYQIVVERMELAGAGALMALFEKLKAKLAGEGLFARERKKPLPFMPPVIGVVTSPTGRSSATFSTGWRIAVRPMSSSGRSRCRVQARRTRLPPRSGASMRSSPAARCRAPTW